MIEEMLYMLSQSSCLLALLYCVCAVHYDSCSDQYRQYAVYEQSGDMFRSAECHSAVAQSVESGEQVYTNRPVSSVTRLTSLAFLCSFLLYCFVFHHNTLIQ